MAEKENGALGHVNKYGTEKLELSLPQALELYTVLNVYGLLDLQLIFSSKCSTQQF